jgi:hypothetical protein
LEVDAGQVLCPSGHAKPWIRVVQHLALGRPACRLLLVVVSTGFDLRGDLFVIGQGGSGLVGLGVAQSDVHEVQVLACQKHLLPGDNAIQLLQFCCPYCLFSSSNTALSTLLHPAMDLLPVVLHAVNMGGNEKTPIGVSSALHPISTNLEHWEWVIQLVRNVDIGRVLDDIVPTQNHVHNRSAFLWLQIMLRP